jgi:ribonuclease HI
MSEKFYAVKCGRTVGIYTTWDECKREVDGFFGAKYMKFTNRQAAEAFLNGEMPHLVDYLQNIRYGPYIPGIPHPIKDWSIYDGEYYIFTDGSKKRDVLRFSIYLGPTALNIAQNLPESTNNRCELLAILKSLELILENKDDLRNARVNVISDSEYSVKSCNLWIKNWKTNNWVTASGTDVANKDIMISLDHIITQLKTLNIKYSIAHMKSHEAAPPPQDSKAIFMWKGNLIADHLAQHKIPASK